VTTGDGKVGGGRRIGTREITLRQLGHMDTDLSFEEKLYWMKLLADAGVDETIVWGIDEDAAELVRRVHDSGMGIELGFYGKVYFPVEMNALLDKARDCGADFVCLNGRGADFSLEESGWTRDQMLDACVVGVKAAKERGVKISIGLAYATQGEPSWIVEVSQAVAEAGADTLYLPDSLGVATPEQMSDLVRRIRELITIPIEVHCHNDYGLATANAVACILAGADMVECFVNGQDPERSGIAALDEVVVALEYLYGFDTGIELERLTNLSRVHEQLTGMRVADNKPVVGRRAFNYRVAPGNAASAPKRDHFYGSPKVVPFDPESVGNERVFMLGKFSGENEVQKRLGELDLTVTDEQLPTVIRLVNDTGRAEKRAITDEELRYFTEVAAVSSRTAAPAGAG
jgi:isopropylmalate/homocitrate/citramalate synthase